MLAHRRRRRWPSPAPPSRIVVHAVGSDCSFGGVQDHVALRHRYAVLPELRGSRPLSWRESTAAGRGGVVDGAHRAQSAAREGCAGTRASKHARAARASRCEVDLSELRPSRRRSGGGATLASFDSPFAVLTLRATESRMPRMPEARSFVPIDIAVLTVSDSRTEETDTSGRLLVSRLEADGHRLAEKAIVPDDVYRIRACVSRWIAEPGRARGGRDRRAPASPGATGPRRRSAPCSTRRSTVSGSCSGRSRTKRSAPRRSTRAPSGGWPTAPSCSACPGSSGACRTAWDRLLHEQLDYRFRPCNLIELLPRLMER